METPLPKSERGTVPERRSPSGGSTVRLTTRAMACDFSVIMNPGPSTQIDAAGEALELIHQTEAWLSIYRPGSEISLVNQTAFQQATAVRPGFLKLLRLAVQLHRVTDGAFDIAAGAAGRLWRTCRREQRIPHPEEIEQVLTRIGTCHLRIDEVVGTVRFDVEGLELDPGAIGKGHALDEASAWLSQRETGLRQYLLHGGHSSLLARGTHNGLPGWPVGLGNPLFANQRLATIVLCDQSMSTSGSNIQFFRHEGRRYGHILDPRTGCSAAGMLSVTVVADSAAVADAMSTAFYVLGIERSLEVCQNLPGIGVILIPQPEHGRRVRPVVLGVPEEQIFWDPSQVVTARDTT